MAGEPTRPDDVLGRVRGEFLEMPGLRLTAPQARRLWGMDQARCDGVLERLVKDQFLFKTRDGSFMRAEYGATIKAVLRPPTKASVA